MGSPKGFLARSIFPCAPPSPPRLPPASRHTLQDPEHPQGIFQKKQRYVAYWQRFVSWCFFIFYGWFNNIIFFAVDFFGTPPWKIQLFLKLIPWNLFPPIFFWKGFCALGLSLNDTWVLHTSQKTLLVGRWAHRNGIMATKFVIFVICWKIILQYLNWLQQSLRGAVLTQRELLRAAFIPRHQLCPPPPGSPGSTSALW